MYQIHNIANNAVTRAQRFNNPTHRGRKQFFWDHQNKPHRILPNKPLVVSAEQIQAMLVDLQEQEKRGLIRVTLVQGGAPVDLQSLRPMEAKEPAPQEPVKLEEPTGALDMTGLHQVAQRDLAPGEDLPPVEFTMPVAPPDAAISNPIVKAPGRRGRRKHVETEPKG